MYGNSPYGSPVLGRGMFQPQVSPQYQQMLEMRDFLRSQRAMPQPAPFQPMPQPLEPMPTAFDRLAPALDISTLQPMEASAVMGDPSMGTPFDPETFDGEARPIEPLDGRQMIGATAPQETSAQLEQVQQAVNQMQQNQQALANHLGAGSQMASNHNQRLLDLNQRQIGLAGLLQPQRPMTQGPESMMLRQIGGRPQ